MANVLSIVTYRILPPRLGGQKGIALFNQYLSQEVSLFCFTVRDNDPALATYTVFNALPRGPFRYINPLYFQALKRIIRENHISHLIVEHPYYGWMGLLLRQQSGVKLVVHSHNIESERFRTTGRWWWPVLWQYERWVHRHADFTFCITARDRRYFTERYGIPEKKSAVVTYGIPWDRVPSAAERASAKNSLLAHHGLPGGTNLFLFNGTLDYLPNLSALKNILDHINPLFARTGIPYRILICGKGLPPDMKELADYAAQNIIYAGFVDDITRYFKGADVFVNPVTEGGGIKTKLVEALGYDMKAVSTHNGAIGVEEGLCNGKLYLTGNDDWEAFAQQMERSLRNQATTPQAYFDHFYWKNIAAKAAGIIRSL